MLGRPPPKGDPDRGESEGPEGRDEIEDRRGRRHDEDQHDAAEREPHRESEGSERRAAGAVRHSGERKSSVDAGQHARIADRPRRGSLWRRDEVHDEGRAASLRM
jgi:hypothetical protein